MPDVPYYPLIKNSFPPILLVFCWWTMGEFAHLNPSPVGINLADLRHFYVI